MEGPLRHLVREKNCKSVTGIYSFYSYEIKICIAMLGPTNTVSHRTPEKQLAVANSRKHRGVG